PCPAAPPGRSRPEALGLFVAVGGLVDDLRGPVREVHRDRSGQLALEGADHMLEPTAHLALGLGPAVQRQRRQAEVDDGPGTGHRVHGDSPYSAAANWAASVESLSAVVEDRPFEITVATWSK